MVEFQKFPFETFRGMAYLAIFIELFQMDIGMAVDAGHCQRFINYGFAISAGIMAFFTGNVLMFSSQGVPRRVMVR